MLMGTDGHLGASQDSLLESPARYRDTSNMISLYRRPNAKAEDFLYVLPDFYYFTDGEVQSDEYYISVTSTKHGTGS